MAHFAKLGINGKVLSVHVVSNNDCLNADGIEDESVGQQFLENLHGWPAELWIKTSYNTKNNKYYNNDNTLSDDQTKVFRGNYASSNYTWDEDNQIFWPPKPYNSWVKHIPTASWKSPIGDAPALTEEQITQNNLNTYCWRYDWNEQNQTWDLVDKYIGKSYKNT